MRTVLLIEDDPDIRLTFSLLLRFQGFSVTSVANIAEGIDRLDIHPDFVLCGVNLQNRSELALVESMMHLAKSQNQSPHFVFISPSASDELIHKSLGIGASCVLKKPVDHVVLHATLLALESQKERFAQI